MSLERALSEAIADRLPAGMADAERIEKLLAHRDYPGDSFWFAWDDAVAEGDSLVRLLIEREEIAALGQRGNRAQRAARGNA